MPTPPGGWRQSTVREVTHPHPGAVILTLDVPDRQDHLPGQHYIIRLTAEDGYSASRSYSISSAPYEPLVEFYVEHLPGGEVSGYLADVIAPGDAVDVRGPIGGWFVWDGRSDAVGIGGGTGVAPLVSMLRHARHVGTSDLLTLVVADRRLIDLPYAAELERFGAVIALSREVSSTRRQAAEGERQGSPRGHPRPGNILPVWLTRLHRNGQLRPDGFAGAPRCRPRRAVRSQRLTDPVA